MKVNYLLRYREKINAVPRTVRLYHTANFQKFNTCQGHSGPTELHVK